MKNAPNRVRGALLDAKKAKRVGDAYGDVVAVGLDATMRVIGTVLQIFGAIKIYVRNGSMPNHEKDL